MIYAPDSNHSAITINGNSTSNFTGVIYAPGADIDMLGTGNVDAYDVQVIGLECGNGRHSGYDCQLLLVHELYQTDFDEFAEVN